MNRYPQPIRLRTAPRPMQLLLLGLCSLPVLMLFGLMPGGTANPLHAASLLRPKRAGIADIRLHFTTGNVAFERRVIGRNIDQGHGVVAADLDGDGDNDIAATDYVDGIVFWYENDGSGSFTERILDPELRGAYPVHVGDVDQDGDPDLFAGGYTSDTYAWYRNDGGGAFTRLDIDTNADGAHSLVTVDLDKDGDIDLVVADQDSNSIAWYENNGSNSFARKEIHTGALAAKRAEVADFNGDGEVDILTAAFDSNEIAWFRNNGSELFTKRSITKQAEGAYYAVAADVDGDGDPDVLSASQLDGTIRLYRNDGTGAFSTTTLNTAASGARTVITADIDGDGHVDALSASVNNDMVAWYRNDGRGNFTQFIIDETADGAYGLFATDMEFDGDMDVLSIGKFSNEVVIHTQIRRHHAVIESGSVLMIDRDRLQATAQGYSASDLIFTLTAPPTRGALRLDTVELTEGSTFTQEDLDRDRVLYQHSAEAGGTSDIDAFRFAVTHVGADLEQAATGIFEIETAGAPLPPQLRSNDFDRCRLDTERWSWRDPAADSGYALEEKRLAITVAAGQTHDLWTNSLNAPRLIRAVSQQDFTLTARFDSIPTGQNQMQGIVVEGKADRMLRFDVNSSAAGLRAFVAIIDDNLAEKVYQMDIPPVDGDGILLRVTHLDGQWAFAYSIEGIRWQPVGTFVDPVKMTGVGFFAGNAGENPAFTALIDYVEIAVDPLVDEDTGPLAPRLLPTTGGSVEITPSEPPYSCDTLLTLVPVADDGHVFSHWSGDLAGSDVPLVVPFENGLEIGAHFVSLATITPSPTTSVTPTAAPTASATASVPATSVPPTAVPTPGPGDATLFLPDIRR